MLMSFNMEASTLRPRLLTGLFIWTTLCLISSGQSALDASGLPLAIRVPLRQGARAESPPQLPPAAAVTRGNTGKYAARRRRGAAASGISFVDMIDNLRGKSGQGYYVEMAVGSPPQKSEECQLGAAAVYRLAHRGRRVEGGRESDEVVEEEKKVKEGMEQRNE